MVVLRRSKMVAAGAKIGPLLSLKLTRPIKRLAQDAYARLSNAHPRLILRQQLLRARSSIQKPFVISTGNYYSECIRWREKNQGPQLKALRKPFKSDIF